tara:strand:- start:149336 stop:150109 length:774 start_codon:yes stop_codon:yes gene_type:complete
MAIDFEVSDGIATVTINRPERLNAMDGDHYRMLSDAWIKIRDTDQIRAAVVTGAGDRSFSVGADLKSFTTSQMALSQTWLPQRDMLINRGLEVFKPVISAINGYCIGGGLTLMLATDIRVCSQDATFGLAEVKRGVIAANGGTQRILKQLPYAIGMEMLLTGDTISADEAERWGLINRVVAKADVLAAAYSFAQRIAENAPLALQASKELALRSQDMDLASGLRAEQLTLRLLQTSDDNFEGASAFAEKRKPRFQGR